MVILLYTIRFVEEDLIFKGDDILISQPHLRIYIPKFGHCDSRLGRCEMSQSGSTPRSGSSSWRLKVNRSNDIERGRSKKTFT